MFKYLSDVNIDNVLVMSALRFTQPSFFNDPFEAQVHTKGLEEEHKAKSFFKENFGDMVNKELNSLNLPANFETIVRQKINIEEGSELLKSILCNPDFKQAQKTQFNKNINENIGILSLSTDNKNLLMWAHYANSHKGICIEFNTENSFFNQKKSKQDSLRYLAKVTYSEKRPSLYLSEFNETEALLTKSIEWSYENEYRILLPLADANKKISNGIEDIYLFNFPKESVKAIYFGSKITVDNKNKIINLIKNNNDYNHVDIYEAKISDELYELVFTKLNV